MRIEKYGRHWAVYDATGELIAVTVYKKGAVHVVNRLTELLEELVEALDRAGISVEDWNAMGQAA